MEEENGLQRTNLKSNAIHEETYLSDDPQNEGYDCPSQQDA